MKTIKVLDKNTIDKIAAGEVVDRPASIVKELVENAIDAGADSVSVEIKDGGTSLIRVTDNGSGISADQISLAFLRHSTSKIQDAADLSFIHTLGFRGEALSSIAAVSRVELCTKTEQALTGVIYKINGGEEESFREAGLPEGTTMLVRDLFFNTPARRKFLKSAQTEAGYIQDIVQRIALSRPDIAFKFTSNQSVRLSTPGNGSLRDTVYAIFGRDIAANMLSLNEQGSILGIDGFIGKPEIARGNRNFEFFFVNGRYVKDQVIQRALEEAYIGYQMKGTFPFAILNITLEPELVDVNVHPSKMEIRFFDSEQVYREIYEIIRNRIVNREDILLSGFGKEPKPLKTEKPESRSIPEPFETAFILKEQHSYGEESEPRKPFREPAEEEPDYETETPAEKTPERKEEVYEQQVLSAPEFLSEEAKPSHRIIGELFSTYWIVEYDDKLFIIDQHAAHEKVLYEQFMKNLKERKHASQQIFPSLIVTLSPGEEQILTANMEKFREIGFEAEPFGGNEYAISAVPADLISMDYRVLFFEMLEDLSSGSSKDADILTEKIAAAACKAAVKGGMKLSLSQADALIDKLLSLENPYHCPHGRPTIISMTRYEIEKKFKRII